MQEAFCSRRLMGVIKLLAAAFTPDLQQMHISFSTALLQYSIKSHPAIHAECGTVLDCWRDITRHSSY